MSKLLQHMVLKSLAALLLCYLMPVEAAQLMKQTGAQIRQSSNANKSVFVVADWGGIGSSPFVTPWEVTTAAAMDSLSGRLPDGSVEAVFALGDNFYSFGVKNVEDDRFRTTFEAVFNGSRLRPTPWYLVAGNHDWLGNASAQILYSKRSSRWNFPDYFHTKVIQLDGIGCAAFILVDTVLLSESAEALHPDDLYRPPTLKSAKSARRRPKLTDVSIDKYFSWLEKQLQLYYSYPYLFVAGHHPVWSIGQHGPTSDLVRRLDPLLLKYKVNAYLCGHEHNMQHIVLNGTDYFVAGAAAHVTTSMAHMGLFPPGSVRYYWNKQADLDGAFMTLGFGSDYANATFVEAGSEARLLYSARLPRRRVHQQFSGLDDGVL
ncbi:hypothetical protein BOX15_Mlig019221g1 [Macrostomum lignano]|uniref:Tartrate-resistant acid phosphatase type 5 n=1 Tax=Macrostomum lignano TaxID=282301 RepID=A0A267EYU3_9PLAT|nr:hypothetical protein BOX15_Mlig019221g1 [Macrostomum lignano]